MSDLSELGLLMLENVLKDVQKSMAMQKLIGIMHDWTEDNIEDFYFLTAAYGMGLEQAKRKKTAKTEGEGS